MKRRSVEAAWHFFAKEKSATEHDNVAMLDVARRLDRMDRENHERRRAIAHFTEEIERLKRAPEVNQCEMKEEWTKAIEVYQTAIEIMEEAIDE